MLIATNTIDFSARINVRGRLVAGPYIHRGERFEAPNEATRARLLKAGAAIDESDPAARIFEKTLNARLEEEGRRAARRYSDFDKRRQQPVTDFRAVPMVPGR